MPVSNEEIIREIASPMSFTFEKHGITPTYLAKKLKRELNAKKTEKVKMKGSVDRKSLPKGFKVVAETETIHINGVNGNGSHEVEGTGESLVHYSVIDWGTRQKARMDAHKLLNHYPAQKVTHGLEESLEDALRVIQEKRGNI